jgi:hypothetical protein
LLAFLFKVIFSFFFSLEEKKQKNRASEALAEFSREKPSENHPD